MESKKLIGLGFSNTEASLYILLLELGQAQAGLLSKKSQMNRTTTYDTLERLIKKGLVAYSIQANKKIFRAANPKQVIDNLKEQDIPYQEILPELNSLYKTSKAKEEFNIYQGKKGIKSILQDILDYKAYIAFGSRGKFLEIMKHDFIAFQRRKKALKIKSRIILGKSTRSSEQVKVAYAKFRFIPDEFSSPTTTFIYGNQIAIIIWGEVPIATVITSKDIAESYSHYFELLWRQAKP